MSRRKEYIGIDPGVGGGIAIAWGQDNIHQYKMPPTEREICDVFNGSMCDLVYSVAVIEKVHSMPKQGVASTFKFGMNYGFLRGCLIAAGIPFEEVTPRAWQKALGIPPKKKTESNTEWKNRLKGMAQQLYPQLKVTLATSDALLIATYCKRKYEGTL